MVQELKSGLGSLLIAELPRVERGRVEAVRDELRVLG